jgi:signal transduction histidine kinase
MLLNAAEWRQRLGAGNHKTSSLQDVGRALDIVSLIRAVATGHTPQHSRLTIEEVIADAIELLRTAFDQVRCTVEDNGTGIDPCHLPHLFEHMLTTEKTGMGMGLIICRSIVEARAGSVCAENNSSSNGARFSFTLPAVRGLKGRPASKFGIW